MRVDFLSAVKGGFFFHPSDQDPSPGTPVMKKPLECVLSVYSNSETAVVGQILHLLERLGISIPLGSPNPIY